MTINYRPCTVLETALSAIKDYRDLEEFPDGSLGKTAELFLELYMKQESQDDYMLDNVCYTFIALSYPYFLEATQENPTYIDILSVVRSYFFERIYHNNPGLQAAANYLDANLEGYSDLSGTTKESVVSFYKFLDNEYLVEDPITSQRKQLPDNPCLTDTGITHPGIFFFKSMTYTVGLVNIIVTVKEKMSYQQDKLYLLNELGDDGFEFTFSIRNETGTVSREEGPFWVPRHLLSGLPITIAVSNLIEEYNLLHWEVRN